MTGWVDIGALEDIPRQGARVVKTSGGCVAIFRTADDEVFALRDSCPHKAGPLSDGIDHGKSVTCPLHNWVIEFETGEVAGVDEGSVPVYPTQVVDGRVQLDIARFSEAVRAA